MRNNKKVVCIVQARMSSSRLPGKVILPILGEPMISYTLKRLERCKTVDETVLATSVHNSDGALCDYVRRAGFDCFRGSLDDVLERYVQANREHKGDVVIRVTGDCPLIDPELVDLTVNAFLESGKDYVSLATPIRGFDTEVFSAEALERTYNTVTKLEDFKNYKEHVTIYMYRHPEEFTLGSAVPPVWLKGPYRLCVDEEDDFRVVDAVFNYFKNPYPTAKEVVEFLDANSEIAFINNHVMQKKA